MNAAHYHTGGFPPADLDWERLIPLLGPARASVGRYEGVLYNVPNPDVLLSPLMTQEAVLSSRIEGTQATLGEVLQFEAEGGLNDESTSKKADIREIINYRRALTYAIDQLRSLPLSHRLIKKAHEILMQGVRGRSMMPGEFRNLQNWIGPPGADIGDAHFIPCPANELPTAMGAWEVYINETGPDVLVQLAIAHAEFEAIHPFLDGNGRIGRLIVPLFLYAKKVLTHPNFYISEYLESHRDEYYERLRAISGDGDWTGWCAFFLNALIAQADINTNKAQTILDLHTKRREWIVEKTHSQYAVRALDWIFNHPIFRASDYVTNAGIPDQTARIILNRIRENGLLTEITPSSGRRSAIYAYGELLNIAEGSDVF